MGNNNTDTHAQGGIGFSGILAIVFITLKLTGVIDWSWWWVLSPLWLPFVALLLIIGIVIWGASGRRK